MKVRRVGTRYLVKGEPGDVFPAALVKLAKDHGWMSGSVTGLGGVKAVELAYFDLNQKCYLPIQVDGIVELVSLTGNLARVGEELFWHLHAAVSDVSGKVTAGHLVSLEVAVTLECWVDVSAESVIRARDDSTGLNLLDL